ncbi:hypothetical protein N7G274_007627 [Stereocaulon virgatum]|uniref:Uncharacterized protein n=1 Tax=Stereocaulon virgatum TaxID=373712 RepID=A0ABR4A3Z3_9LECA
MDRTASRVEVDGVGAEESVSKSARTRDGGTRTSRSQKAEKSRRQQTMSMEKESLPPSTIINRPPSASTSPSTSRPSSSRHNSSRRSSTAYTLSRPSKTCPRRSSFLIRQPSEIPTWRPRVPQRRSSTAHYRASSTDSFAVHSKSVLLFQSLEASVANVDPLTPRPTAHLTSVSLPTLQSPAAAAVEPCPSKLSSILGESPELQQHSYSNHVPATTIDWTLPSTRRRQYNEIKKSSRGIRGLVRRITPSSLWSKGNRVGFYDAEKGSDGGTMRRYRLDPDDDDSIVGDGEDEKHRSLMEVLEVGGSSDCGGRGTERRWSCFPFRRDAAKKA